MRKSDLSQGQKIVNQNETAHKAQTLSGSLSLHLHGRGMYYYSGDLLEKYGLKKKNKNM
jgi:hypothetical protein